MFTPVDTREGPRLKVTGEASPAKVFEFSIEGVPTWTNLEPPSSSWPKRREGYWLDERLLQALFAPEEVQNDATWERSPRSERHEMAPDQLRSTKSRVLIATAAAYTWLALVLLALGYARSESGRSHPTNAALAAIFGGFALGVVGTVVSVCILLHVRACRRADGQRMIHGEALAWVGVIPGAIIDTALSLVWASSC